MGPAAHQSGGQVLELRQLDFQLAFVGTGALGENVQDQPGAIDYARIEQFFQVAFLDRAEQMIHQHQVGLQRTHGFGDLFGLAGAYVVAWIGGFDTCGNAAQDFGTSRLDQLSELFGSAYRVALPARMREDDDSTVAFLLTIKQSESTFRLGGSNDGVAMAVVTIANAYIAAGHYGRDGVFIDQL